MKNSGLQSWHLIFALFRFFYRIPSCYWLILCGIAIVGVSIPCVAAGWEGHVWGKWIILSVFPLFAGCCLSLSSLLKPAFANPWLRWGLTLLSFIQPLVLFIICLWKRVWRAAVFFGLHLLVTQLLAFFIVHAADSDPGLSARILFVFMPLILMPFLFGGGIVSLYYGLRRNQVSPDTEK